MELIYSALVTFVAIIPAYVSWNWQERAKKRREGYEKLLILAGSFYENGGAPQIEGRQSFIDEYRKSFLYASDDVVRSINNFYESINTGNDKKDVDREERFAEMLLTMRKNVNWRRSQLTSKDYKHLGVSGLKM